MQRIKKTYIIISIILLVLSSGLMAQRMDKKWKIGPEYKIDYVVKPSTELGKGELNIMLSVPYDEIHFVKQNSQFKGRFDISIMIFEGKEKRVSESWIEKLTVDEFKLTNSRKKIIEMQKNYVLAPGKYRLEVLITDLKTQNRRKQVKEIDMSKLSKGPWMMGDLYFMKDSSAVKGSDDMPEAIYVGFSASGIEGKYPFSYILQSRDKTFKQGKFEIDLVKERHEYIFPVRTADLSYNQYFLTLMTVIDSIKYKRSIPLRVQWSGTSSLIPNLEEAIEQMRYLSHTGYFPSRTYKKMMNAEGKEQKDFFTETWKNIDPTPHTENNELMNEYYYRVHVANQRFSGHREGWRSDRGMIYVIYGDPDAVEEHHMEINTKPYMIWYYYSVNRSFIFIDHTGFGDYQLSEPLSEY
ncbi:MAG: GWxTD domain-containing protein, partial [Candidatus Marinimicrobia bacterium]|nr:GWxTD domain-containing protein [Candidatus Neomarinimicrobiota bacterium]